jgi:cell division protein ZipA
MPELRWTLLIIGVLFVAILAWWERRRPHQAPRNNDPPWGPDVESVSAPRAATHAVREPTLTLPEIRADVRTREPIAPRELPIVQIGEDLEAEDEIRSEKAVSPQLEEDIAEELEEISEEISADASKDAEDDFDEDAFDEDATEEAAEEEASTEAAEAGIEATGAGTVAAAASAAAAEKAVDLPPPVTTAARPIVEWPPEEQRKLIALRLVARPPERFRGNLVRQALAAEGFVLGDLDIFHKPDAQNRAVLSAASLTKPGTFDLETMDTQRFVGLNLFAVLPGPKSPRKAFEDLLMAARMLNERLEGALQDERGGPLTPMRIQALRDALEAEAKS